MGSMKKMNASIRYLGFLMVVLLLICSSCAHHKKIPYEPVLSIYAAKEEPESLLIKHVPYFLTYDFQNHYNRIGNPSANIKENGKIKIFVDPQQPVIFAMEKPFSTDRGNYKNLIYRVHFPKVPFSLIPFNLTAGNNVGLMVVITLDHNHKPVLISTVHTCGCYLAMIPTTGLAPDAYPSDWKEETMNVYGEKLPPILDFNGKSCPRLLLHLRPEVHRVMNIVVVEEQDILKARQDIRLIDASMAPMNCLEQIPVNDEAVSFFYEKGLLQGYVRGSVKPWETILLSWISLDLFVGTDKAYDDPQKTKNPFYTSLKPWNRHKSNMWYFPEFLRFWGWDL